MGGIGQIGSALSSIGSMSKFAGAAGGMLPGIGLGLQVLDWGLGAANKANEMDALKDSLTEGIAGVGAGMRSAASRVTNQIGDIWEGVGDSLESLAFDTGSKIGDLSTSTKGLIKKSRGLKTGTVDSLIEKETTRIQDELDITHKKIFNQSSSQISEIGYAHEVDVGEATAEIADMQEQYAYAEDHDDWYENLI